MRGTDKLHFFYDAQSRPAMVEYNGVMYTYVHNLQGDIVGILDSTGAVVVEHSYDASTWRWDKVREPYKYYNKKSYPYSYCGNVAAQLLFMLRKTKLTRWLKAYMSIDARIVNGESKYSIFSFIRK